MKNDIWHEMFNLLTHGESFVTVAIVAELICIRGEKSHGPA